LISVLTRSAGETIRLGEAVGAACHPGSVLALYGPLAAGKTTFSQGVARALGVTEPVLSPTFTLVNDYSGTVALHHMDAYRLAGPEDFIAIGAEEIMADGGVSVIEWSERIEPALPRGRTRISIRIVGEEERVVEIDGPIEAALAESGALSAFRAARAASGEALP